MDLSGYSIAELVSLYSQTIKELKHRGVLRTKNVVGELGEYLVLEYYDQDPKLPNLTVVPVGTKNINAISINGDRYTIKATSGNVTGVIYGLQPLGSSVKDTQLFEYMVVCKLDDDCGLEGIYQLTWDGFQKHKKWHSRMKAWNIALTKAMKKDSKVVYEKGESEYTFDKSPTDENSADEQLSDVVEDDKSIECIVWNKTQKVNHREVRKNVAAEIQKKVKCELQKESQSRYVSSDKATAVFVLSASYSVKNGEYWYSINDENIPWMELFPKCYVAFALGSAENTLLFPYVHFKDMLSGCLRTKEEPEKNKKAHYHFSFSVEGSIVYFKKKVPTREFINVSDYLM